MTTVVISYLLSALAGYLVGSVPVGMLIARLRGVDDLRHTGSGSIGATNVLRAVGPVSAAATMVIDGGKAALIYGVLFFAVGEYQALTAGFLAVFGHCYPVWLRFNGGKAAAASCGLAMALAWPLGILSLMLWFAVIVVTSYVSLGAIVVSLTMPLIGLAVGISPPEMTVVILLGILALIRHIPNIRRLVDGREPTLSLWRR